MEEILNQAKSRWLNPADVASLITANNSYRLELSVTAIDNPASGTLVFFDRNEVSDFQNDGFKWCKKPLEMLKVGNDEILMCSSSDAIGRLQKRCYWMAEESSSDRRIVAVHYREIEKGSSLFVQERDCDSYSKTPFVPQSLKRGKNSFLLPLRHFELFVAITTFVALWLLICCCRSGRGTTSLVGQIMVENVRCSENGDVYQDVLFGPNSKPICECHPCYKGEDCSELDENCVLDLNSGSPRMFDCYWKTNDVSSRLVIPGSYRMGYENNGQESFFSLRALELLIQQVHKVVGNAVTENKHLVIGTGSTQLYMAAIFALSGDTSGEPAMVTAADPHYQLYHMVPPAMKSTLFSWGGNTSSSQVLTAKRTIELVTTPNNPDGLLRKPKLSGPNATSIFDLAYYWPHFTPILHPVDEDLMMFTLSKLTGHAGSRIGWAFVKDPIVAQKMQLYIIFMSLGVAHESQLRAAQLLTSLLSGIEKDGNSSKVPVNGFEEVLKFSEKKLCISYAAALMQGRWAALKSLFLEAGPNARVALQPFEAPHKCTFYGTVRESTPAYLWLSCQWPMDLNCAGLFTKYKLIGREGPLFGMGPEYIRFSLLSHQSSFEVFMVKLRTLIFDVPFVATNVTAEMSVVPITL